MAKSAKRELRGAFFAAKDDPVEGVASVAVGAAGAAGAAASTGSLAARVTAGTARTARRATTKAVGRAGKATSKASSKAGSKAAKATSSAAKATGKASTAISRSRRSAVQTAPSPAPGRKLGRVKLKPAPTASVDITVKRRVRPATPSPQAAALALEAARRRLAARQALVQARVGLDAAVAKAWSASEGTLASALDTPTGKKFAATGAGSALAARVAPPRRQRNVPRLVVLALVGGGTAAAAAARSRSAPDAPRFEPSSATATPTPVPPAATGPASAGPGASAEGARTIEPVAPPTGVPGVPAPIDDTMAPGTAGGSPLAGVVDEDPGAVEAVSPGATELPPATEADRDGRLGGPAA